MSVADSAGQLVITEMQLGRLGAAAAAEAAAAAAVGNEQGPLPGSAVNSVLRALGAALGQQGDDRDMDMDINMDMDMIGGEGSDSEMADADPAAAAQEATARRLPGGPDDGSKRRHSYSTASATFTLPDPDSSMSEEEVQNLLQQLLMELLHFKVGGAGCKAWSRGGRAGAAPGIYIVQVLLHRSIQPSMASCTSPVAHEHDCSCITCSLADVTVWQRCRSDTRFVLHVATTT